MTSTTQARLALLLLAAVLLPVWHLTASGRADLGVLLDVALGVRETTAQLIVWELGLPRLACALLAGAALGVSGLVLQSALRNPLAAPEITGVNSGAVLGVLVAVTTGLAATDAVSGTLMAALVGGLVQSCDGQCPFPLYGIGSGLGGRQVREAVIALGFPFFKQSQRVFHNGIPAGIIQRFQTVAQCLHRTQFCRNELMVQIDTVHAVDLG
jgi:hypothetical protein